MDEIKANGAGHQVIALARTKQEDNSRRKTVDVRSMILNLLAMTHLDSSRKNYNRRTLDLEEYLGQILLVMVLLIDRQQDYRRLKFDIRVMVVAVE